LVDGTFTKQHFAKMWYNALIDSPAFLNLTNGHDDPYSWTSREGCDYTLRGSRATYRNTTDQNLKTASEYLYFLSFMASLGKLKHDQLILLHLTINSSSLTQYSFVFFATHF